MGKLGGSELLILALLFLLAFGANRLPEAGRAVGKGIREFRRALNEARDAVERPEAERPPEAAPPKRLIE